MEFDLQNPLENFHDLPYDSVPPLFFIESDQNPSPNYFHKLIASDSDISIRRSVISIISQKTCTFDPVLTYLAINYLDRYIANQGILQSKPWANKLLAISCFSLAAKMLKTEFSATDVEALLNQGDGGVIFETQTIQRMEAIVLGALQWRMRSITPFSFFPFFINLFTINDPALIQVLKDRASEIILKSQREIKVLEFKPSIIAASALLSASHELFPFQYPSFLRAISDCSYVNKESMQQCYNVIPDIAMEEYESVFNVKSSSETPINVLDQNFLSFESEKTNNAALMQGKELNKRRRITDYGNNNHTVHISHSHQC
ncbi:PREDICTED: putative cyclin-D6-1 isoform X2 [Lupinus angustifolius]|uniref:putative cyclin-D6-1 isoform X2 n=1 Tax=Lupinus angustifolius TaxID=3871 RepID=UPI00092F9D8B|nr:PREDICTED: putative cyclin-D6-1 isoform X2 [Lupinus angustifolius]